MKPLEKLLRNKLEKTVKDARDIAEDAARAALEQLGVGEPTAYPHFTETDRVLRRKLRTHGRQLGNGRNAKGEQALDRLIEEVAYEHWHRMLFARFLAENNLLMYPDPDDPVAVTLEECEDLAADEGASNGWELASRYAARMLPQIFRPDSPVFQLTLPPEHQQKLERLIADLSKEVFTASDSLGWVYQFWQAKKKDEINASEVKIGARELPAVTQLFTEPYMVSFLLDNSLGAWWAARRLTEADLKNAKTEDELRRKASLPGVGLEYLRFVKGEDGKWIPAAGTFDGWPEKLAEFKTLDPCCGSGHFFVAAFLMLVPMRMEREGLSARQAVDRVLSENIHGLELDQRCVELAAFALALTAWKYPNAGGYRLLPELNVACSGLAISAKKEDWLALAGDNTNLRLALVELYKQFKDSPVLGSLINPEASLGKDSLFELKWKDVGPLLTKALSGEKDDEKVEMGVAAQGLAKVADLLTQQYDLVVTNVPYLARTKQATELAAHCEKHFPESKNDLSNTFVFRIVELCSTRGFFGAVTKQDWQYQDYEKKFRNELLKYHTFNMLAWLGARGFSTPMFDFNVVLMLGAKAKAKLGHKFSGFDVSDLMEYEKKALALIDSTVLCNKQSDQLNNPDARILLRSQVGGNLLSEYATYQQGICTGDLLRFGKKFWELYNFYSGWVFQQSTVSVSRYYGGLENILFWQSGSGKLYESIADRLGEERVGSWLRGGDAWGKNGVAVSSTGVISSAFYIGNLYDDSTMVLIPKKEDYLLPIWSFCESNEYNKEVRKVDRKLKVRSALVKVPFDLDYWTKVAEEKYPNGLPKPYSDDPTQWIFHGHPAQSEEPLQVAIARLLGYRWPAETDPDMKLSEESHVLVEKSQRLLPFADEDGIVCIPPVRGEMKAEDRLENLLAAAYGSEWSSNKKAELFAQAGHAGKTLETWLRDKFFTQHCKLFQHRPFIWHIWDGLHDGFAALVNYHKLNAKLLETLIYTYLGDWISRQKQGIANGVDGAQEKLSAAEVLKKKLELILEGEAPYDIFVRWKSIEKQPIGWNPDLNDGIRLNIRPFMTVPDVGKKGAGILRDKPNIKWGKDRGKDVASAPWYHLGPIYGGNEGDRINDHHLTLEEKQKAREQIK